MALVSCFGGALMSYELRELRIFQAILYLIMAMPTFVLNLIVLVGIWRTTALHKPSKLLLSSLAATDLLYGAIVMPILAASNMARIQHHFSVYCYTWLVSRAFGAWFGGMSLYTLAAISADRFLAIKIRFSYRHEVTTKRIVPVLLVGWLGNPLLMGIMSRLILKTKTNSRNEILITGISICLVLITISYSLAFYYLHKVTREQKSMNTENQVTRSNFDISGYRATLKTMIIILVVTILFYLPYVCCLILEIYDVHSQMNEGLILIGEMLLSLNSTVNPILYLWRMAELRATVKVTLNGIFGT